MPYQRIWPRIHSEKKKNRVKSNQSYLGVVMLFDQQCLDVYLQEVNTVFSLFSKISRASSQLQRSSTHSLSMLPGFISSKKLLARLRRISTWLAALSSRKTGERTEMWKDGNSILTAKQSAQKHLILFQIKTSLGRHITVSRTLVTCRRANLHRVIGVQS